MTPIKKIRNVLTVLFSGVAFGCLIAFYFIYFYGSSGNYSAANVILSPEVLSSMNFKDTNLRTGSNTKFVFQKIEFSYKDPKTHAWQLVEIPLEKYSKFYSLVSGDRSISVAGIPIEDFFRQAARLVITIKTESDAEWQRSTKIFQEIHFSSEKDYYRVELHQEDKTDPWVYFHHPDIYEKLLETFIP